MAADDKFCRLCGRDTSSNSLATASSVAPAEANPATTIPGETSGKAIASFVCGLFIFAFPMSILAIIFGHLSLSDIRKGAGRLQGKGLATAGLVLGYAGVAFIPLILIIAAIAIPNLLRARMAANESSAVASVRILVVAEVSYLAAHPEAGYTCSLADLAGAGSVDQGLASGRKSGYNFELAGCDPGPQGAANVKFRVLASPLTNATGTRAFCSNESGVIKTDSAGSVQRCLDKGSAL